jgi:hypothetical protein
MFVRKDDEKRSCKNSIDEFRVRVERSLSQMCGVIVKMREYLYLCVISMANG